MTMALVACGSQPTNVSAPEATVSLLNQNRRQKRLFLLLRITSQLMVNLVMLLVLRLKNLM